MDIFKFRETYGSPIKVEDFDSEIEQSPPTPSAYPSICENSIEYEPNSPDFEMCST